MSAGTQSKVALYATDVREPEDSREPADREEPADGTATADAREPADGVDESKEPELSSISWWRRYAGKLTIDTHRIEGDTSSKRVIT